VRRFNLSTGTILYLKISGWFIFQSHFPPLYSAVKTSAIAMFFLKKMGDAASTARVFRVTIKFEFAINHSIQFIATPQ
jgi:hypothetical protein